MAGLLGHENILTQVEEEMQHQPLKPSTADQFHSSSLLPQNVLDATITSSDSTYYTASNMHHQFNLTSKAKVGTQPHPQTEMSLQTEDTYVSRLETPSGLGNLSNTILEQHQTSMIEEPLSSKSACASSTTTDPESLRFDYPMVAENASVEKTRTRKVPPTVYREQDRFVPINNIGRVMRNAVPRNAKISKDAKQCMQECVSEFISFLTSEASDRCIDEKRKTITGDDILYSLSTLGFDNYVQPLQLYLRKYRESIHFEKPGKDSVSGALHGEDTQETNDVMETGLGEGSDGLPDSSTLQLLGSHVQTQMETAIPLHPL